MPPCSFTTQPSACCEGVNTGTDESLPGSEPAASLLVLSSDVSVTPTPITYSDHTYNQNTHRCGLIVAVSASPTPLAVEIAAR